MGGRRTVDARSPAPGERDGRVFGSARIGVGHRNGRIVFRRDRSRRLDRDARGDEEGTLRARERIPEGFDGAPVDCAVPLEIGKVVDEATVDHAVARGGAARQAFEVLERAALDLGARGGHLVRGGVRAREAEDRMARADEVGNDGRADETAGAGDKDTHEGRLRGWTSPIIGCYAIRVNT